MKAFYILTFFLLSSFTAALGQKKVTYPFSDSLIWRVDYKHNDSSSGFIYDVNEYFFYYFAGDTLINSFDYKKIYRSYDSVYVTIWNIPNYNPPSSSKSKYIGALRYDTNSNKVFIKYNSSAEDLLYDYNLYIGDTIKGIIALSNSTNYYSIVSSIDSILIKGKYRKKWNFNDCYNDSAYIIAGIGSFYGLIEYRDGQPHESHLVCVKDSSNTIFVSGYNSSFGCNLIYGGINEISLKSVISFFPNPFSSQTILWTSNPLHNAILTFYNSLGQGIRQISNISGQTVTILRNDLSKGIYIVQLLQNNMIITTTKLVIIE